MSLLDNFDSYLITYLQNNNVSPSILIISFTLIVFIFCLIIAYKTGVSDLPKNYYIKAYKYNKEANRISIENKSVKEQINTLNREAKTHLRNLHKNRLRLEKQAYTLLSKELTKEDYNEEIETLAEDAGKALKETENMINQTEENIFNDPYGSEGL